MSHNATNHLEILFTHCLQSPLKDFHTELRAQKAKRANKKSKYSASIWEQMYALIVRQGIIVSTYHPSSLSINLFSYSIYVVWRQVRNFLEVFLGACTKFHLWIGFLQYATDRYWWFHTGRCPYVRDYG
jgi:hypothetical protein